MLSADFKSRVSHGTNSASGSLQQTQPFVQNVDGRILVAIMILHHISGRSNLLQQGP